MFPVGKNEGILRSIVGLDFFDLLPSDARRLGKNGFVEFKVVVELFVGKT